MSLINRFYLFTLLMCVSPVMSFAQAPTAVEQKIENVMGEWAHHRNQTIVVLDIGALESGIASKDEKSSLEARLETLQNKKISNREWSAYWETEASLTGQLLTLYGTLAPAAAQGPVIFGRSKNLGAWSRLARKKVKNQQLYYEAIEGDIEALNARLRSLKSPADEDKEISADEACNSDLASDLTPFEKHRACIGATRSDLNRLRHEADQSRHKHQLTQRLLNSTKKLIEAQVTDEQLVQEERSISSTEAVRVAPEDDAGQTIVRADDDAWKLIWTTYSKRAAAKETKLSAAVLSSRRTERTLAARLGVLTDRTKRIGFQIKEMETLLQDRKAPTKWLDAFVQTVWQIVKVGWPALFYLLGAFLLVRTVRSYRDRQERKAEEAESGDNDPELMDLTRQFEAAREIDDEAKAIELNEEMAQLESRIKDEAQRLATIARVAAQAATLIIYVATALLVLDALTVDIGPILGGAAIFGLAISFGSQSLVKDVVSGFFILLENQYAVGDVVEIGGHSGGVELITLRRTVLRDTYGRVHNITNGSISSVTNMTQGWARVVLNIGVAYGTDIDHVEAVINAVGEKMFDDPEWAGKLSEKPVYVGVTGFGESEVTVRAWFKTRTFHNWSAEREFNRRVKEAFERENIEIPFPHRSIHITRESLETVAGK